jgi:hypothetical protein
MPEMIIGCGFMAGSVGDLYAKVKQGPINYSSRLS